MLSQKPREIAYRTLRAREAGQDYVEDLLDAECSRSPLSPQDRRLVQEIVYGTVRWQATLDWLVARLTENRPQKPGLQVLLRLGLYQLFWLDRVPDHAIVHETVELAKQAGFGPQAGFVNALLRNCVRDREVTRGLLKQMQAEVTADPETLARAWSHPQWLVTRWLERWGAADTRRLLEWNNTPPPLFARVNTLKASVSDILQRWREEDGVVYDFFRRPWAPENLAFALKEHRTLSRMATFREGWFYIQDPSTLLAPKLLEPRRGQHVLDLCAAPGGKTTLIAQLMANDGRIVALDQSESRLALIRENCFRLGVRCVDTQLFQPHTPIPGNYDRILIDAPCSNTGVLRRRVDLRWRVRPEELQRLARTQSELLRQAAAALKLGGLLVYSTCSLEPEENANVVQHFSDEHPAFRLEDEVELLPFQEGVDGAYAVVFRRTQ